VIARDLGRYGVTCNAIAPGAATRMTQTVPDSARQLRAAAGIGAPTPVPVQQSAFVGLREAEYVAPMVAYLASDDAWNINGGIFNVSGGSVSLAHHPTAMRTVFKPGLWTVAELDDAVQSVLMKDIDNPAPPRDDVEVPGRDVPAVWLEHNAPQGPIAQMRHPAADRTDLTVVHVTHFNALFWDTGDTPARVIEHGVVDPGARYTGELPRAAVVVNEPGRRGRVTGTDLLPVLGRAVPLDVFGIGAGEVGGIESVPQARLHAEMARCRVYLHPVRWTSLGLSLIEAMHLAMPVVALATTEVPEAVPPEAGVISTRVDVLAEALRALVGDPEQARMMGKAARAFALARYGLGRFLADWDDLLQQVAGRSHALP